MLVQKIISSVVELIVFMIIPFIWWLVTARKKCSFFSWIGLKKAEGTKENKTILWTAATAIGFMAVSILMLFFVRGIDTAASEFSGLGLSAIPAILVYAVFNTSLPEELLFRGFLGKRFSNKFGFAAGNLIQSIIFGVMHGVMFFGAAGIIKAVIITVFTGGIAWLMGYINEKKAGGSILPSWAIHASANIFSGVMAAFLLI